jgi:hypothetical protein
MKITVRDPFPVVRATVPLPAGTQFNPHRCPYRLEHSSGMRAGIVQWEKVTRAPFVAEILASFQSAIAGDFNLVADPSPPLAGRAHPFGMAALSLDTPPSFSIDGARQDCAWGRAHRTGPVAITRKFYARNFVGWLTVYDELGTVELSFDVHAANPGESPLVFHDLRLLMPAPVAGWASAWREDCGIGADGALILVAPRLDGKPHGLPQRTGRPFRIVVWGDASQAGLGRAQADAAGVGYADTWTQLGAYGPQAQRFPVLTTKRAEMAALAGARWSLTRNYIQNGLAFGVGTSEGQPGGRHDWLQMWGSPYGGVTSGSFRWQYDRFAVYFALTGETPALLEMRARAWAIAQRMPSLILGKRGNVPVLEGYLEISGAPKGGWRMSSADTDFEDQGRDDGIFDFHAHRTPASIPADWSEITSYVPIDFQHFDRAYSALVGLVWLENDPWAAQRLRVYSELWRMAQFTDGRLAGERAAVTQNLGHGTPWGRAHGLCWTMAAAAYAISDDIWRQRWDPYLLKAVEVLRLAQMPNGLFRAHATNKEAKEPPFDGAFAITKGTEEALLVAALVAMNAQLHTISNGWLLTWAVAGLWDYLWNAGAWSKPANYVAVRPVPRSSTPFVDPPAVKGSDMSEIGAAIGYALAERGSANMVALDSLVRSYCGNLNPLQGLISRKVDAEPAIDDWLPLAAELGG